MATKKKPAPKASKPASSVSPELTLIRDLADILNATGLTEIELDHKGAKVRVAKTVTGYASVSAPAPAPVHMAGPVHAAAPPAPPAIDNANIVKSPMVGTAYLSAGPGSPVFISVGAVVKEGQTVLIIEAMKTMNQIPAPKSGTVTSIIVENAQPVEYGEALLVIE
jgi:acetyl-CoA carboxylase biotin carboxyl carrier protein